MSNKLAKWTHLGLKKEYWRHEDNVFSEEINFNVSSRKVNMYLGQIESVDLEELILHKFRLI